MKKYWKNILIFIVIYSLIFFLILPIVFMDWDMKVPHIFNIAIGLWYLFGILFLFILFIINRFVNKFEKEKRLILATFIIIYIVFEIIMFWSTLLGSRIGIPASVGNTFFIVFLSFGIISPVVFGICFYYYKPKYNKHN